jgi:hypothetical protein
LLLQKSIIYIYWVCVCSLNYTACQAHAPYCRIIVLSVGWLYNFFLHYLINGMIFRKKHFIEHIMCILSFSTAFLLNINLKNNSRDVIKNICWSSFKVLLFFTGFNKTKKFSTDFRNKLNIKFNRNPTAGTELFHWTDRQTWRN